MERHQPWHPFWLPGFCGISKTTCFLAILSVLISANILTQTEAISKGIKKNTPNHGQDQASVPVKIRPKRSAISLTDNPMTITGEKGRVNSFLCDPITVTSGKDLNTENTRYNFGEDLYFCKHPCGWVDVKAYTPNTEYGTDRRFNVTTVTQNDATYSYQKALILKVTMINLTDNDIGTYYCGWGKTGKDGYQAVQLNVIDKIPDPVKKLVPGLKSPEEDAWMIETVKNGHDPVVNRAMLMCRGNKACALAVLQKQELKIEKSCWWCLQMSHAWRAAPLRIKVVNELEGKIPCQIVKVLQAASDLTKGTIPAKHSNSQCHKTTTSYVETSFVTPPIRVIPDVGDVCLCATKPTERLLGWSDCRIKISLINATNNCTAIANNIVHNFTCPFEKPNQTMPAIVWVCGGRAFHHLPAIPWTGCCYPAFMSVGAAVYVADKEKVQQRRKRSTLIQSEMPAYYKGNKLWDPFTGIGAQIGWSLFPFGGTAATINKLNGLAWQVLALANRTEKALGLVNKEMTKIREAVIQNRFALDMLTAEKGGVCKMLGISCCFYIPDYHENITDIINDMRKAVKEPEDGDDSWIDWLKNLWGGWGYWLSHTVLPVVVVVGLVLFCLPCFIRCFMWKIQRLIMSNE
ncbi:hypothetical protein IRJ41_010260 [Triplophysa rosa]|uniref:Uncharacterized protein n=1 Tax=Triplophysa rosa TaxID=992332 RepID=A0A9W7T5P7_TRIRA|nr:hypothetical protein IRJ41_010260 [Triplophysa rosa]